MIDVVISGSNTEDLHGASVSMLREQGYTISMSDKTDMARYAHIVTDKNILESTQDLDAVIAHGSRVITMQHASDMYGASVPKASWNIRAHKAAMRILHTDPLQVMRDDDSALCDQLCSLPPHTKEEFAYSGPFQIGTWASKRHLPRHELRAGLERALGRELPVDRPVVAFFTDEVSLEPLLLDGLRKLAGEVTLVCKGLGEDYLDQLSDVAILWPSTEYSANDLRFGADCILAGYLSGSLSTAVMVGLRVLPYYTKRIRRHGIRHYASQWPSQYVPYGIVSENILFCMDRAYDIQDTSAILDALHSENYWKEYEHRLPQIQSQVFLDYDLNNAAQKTASLILRVLNNNSFMDRAASVRIRPEYIHI